jgi:hypothetical protein
MTHQITQAPKPDLHSLGRGQLYVLNLSPRIPIVDFTRRGVAKVNRNHRGLHLLTRQMVSHKKQQLNELKTVTLKTANAFSVRSFEPCVDGFVPCIH